MNRVLVILLTLWVSSSSALRAAAPAATSAQAPPATTKRSAAELEKLAMPIALHPDPLIAIILPASVYPVEIVMAARFVRDTNNIANVDAQPWDESVKAVAKFPELIDRMDADLGWTVALGQAFLEQRKELMDTIQALRAKAQQAGSLQTTAQQIVTVTNSVVERTVEQQVVVVTNTIVQIQPSNPEVIYVPSYPPAVYGPPYYGYSYWGYYPYAAPLLTFGAGMVWGAAIANWGHCNWGGGDVDIDINNANINRNNNFNRNNNVGRNDGMRGDASQRGGGRQGWQPDQNRLRSSGAAPAARTSEARGWNGGGSQTGQRGNVGSGSARTSQRPTAGTQPARSASAGQRPSTAQRPASSAGASRPSTTRSPSYSGSRGQSQSAFGGVGSGGSSRSYSNRGSSSRGGGGYSGGRGGGGGGRGGGRR